MDDDPDDAHHPEADLFDDSWETRAGAQERDRPEVPGGQWFDHEAGPMVRPYTVTAGRTSAGPRGAQCDLIALVSLDSGARDAPDDTVLGPEHRSIIEMCRAETQTVAELAAGIQVPVGVVRVLLGDLLERSCVKVSSPVPPARLPAETILREVIDGLRAL